MRKFIRHFSLAIVLVAAIVRANAAIAASGQTTLTMDFPEVVILHYFSELELSFTADSVDQAIDEGATLPLITALLPNVSLSTLMLPSAIPSLPGTISVTVDNLWAVRGITSSGEIRVRQSLDNRDATLGTSRVRMRQLRLKQGADSGNQLLLAAPGLVNSTIGGMTFDLDMSRVTTAGKHTGIQFTITATAAP